MGPSAHGSLLDSEMPVAIGHVQLRGGQQHSGRLTLERDSGPQDARWSFLLVLLARLN